jgi:hypothetical protein
MLFLCLVAARQAYCYEHRQSTPSFGVQVGFGRLFGNETFQIPDWPLEDRTVPYRFDLADLHDQWGPSAHVSLRFVLDRSHALGFGFDDIRYKRHSGFTAEERNVLPRWVKFTTFHADYYLYFHRKERMTYYIAPCVGIQQRELRFKGSEVGTQEFRVLYGGGLGVEYFIRRSFSIDASGRVLAMRGGNGTSVAVQPALGFHAYVF